MGAGRKNQTYTLKEKSVHPWTSNCSVTAKNLTKKDLGGVIFGCKNSTINECFLKKLFGLPDSHYAYVKNIDPGLPLFLFNYSDRKLHGIFEAASRGQLKIDPHGWTEDGSDSTPFGAQVRIQIRTQCLPLLEEQFFPVIAENYYEPRLFWFELDCRQTDKLISMFSASTASANSYVSKYLENLNTLLRVSWARRTQLGGNHPDTPTSDISYPELGSINWNCLDISGKDGESQMSKYHNGREVENNYDWGVRNVNLVSGRSYSSVVRKTNTYDAVSDHFSEELGSWSYPPLPKSESQLFESATYEDAQLKPYSEQSHFLDVMGTSTPVAAIKWSSLFKTESPESTEPSEASFYHWSQPIATEADETFGRNDQELVSVQPSSVVHSFVVAKESTSFHLIPSCERQIDTHSGLEGESYMTETAEVNSPHPEQCKTEQSSSYVVPCSNGEIPAREAPADVDRSSERSKEGKEVHQQDEDTSEIKLSQKWFSEVGMLSDMRPTGLNLVVANLIQEVEDLKSSHLKQYQKIDCLEEELVLSRIEMQRLQDHFKMFDSRTSPAVGLVEEAGFESTNEMPLDFDKSILLVGGYDGSSWLSSLDSYNPSLDLVKSLSPMSCMRIHASAAKLNGEIYIIGGGKDNFCYDTVESYHPVLNRWVVCPSLNQRKRCLANVSWNNKIFAIGGGNEDEIFSDVEMFDVDVGRWIPIRSMLNKRFSPAAAEINGIFYVIGGYDGSDYIRSMERFDPREGSWIKLENMSTDKGCHSLAVLNEKLYALGGYDGDAMISTVEIFDPRVGSWIMGESMIDRRGYFGASVIRDAICVFGGLNNDGEILDTVEYYKEGQGWRSTNLKAIGKRCFFSTMVF